MLEAIHEEVEAARWGQLEELLALNTEILHSLYRLMFAANTKKGTRLPKPLRIPRPSVGPKPDDDELEEPRVTRHSIRRLLMGGGKADGNQR